MDENTFWYNIFKIIAVVAAIGIVSLSGCNMNRHYQTRILIENAKIDPISANCAMTGDSIGTAACIIRSLKSGD